jgi:hypothetical protein
MRAFCGLEFGCDAIPTRPSLSTWKVRRTPARRHDRDATLTASPSTKNREGERDPEMHSSKEGN